MLARLAGRWSGNETLHPPDAPRQRAYGRFDMRRTCEGFFLVSDYEQSMDNVVVYRGHGVYGWEQSIARFTMFWFDEYAGGGSVKPILGAFEDDCLCFQHAVEPGFKRYVYELVADDEFTFRLESSMDGAAWITHLDGRYRRT